MSFNQTFNQNRKGRGKKKSKQKKKYLSSNSIEKILGTYPNFTQSSIPLVFSGGGLRQSLLQIPTQLRLGLPNQAYTLPIPATTNVIAPEQPPPYSPPRASSLSLFNQNPFFGQNDFMGSRRRGVVISGGGDRHNAILLPPTMIQRRRKKKQKKRGKPKLLSQRIADMEKRNGYLEREMKKSRYMVETQLKNAHEKIIDFLECSLCNTPYTDKKTKYIYSCGHSFCKGCSIKWLQNKLRCPLCNTLNPTWKEDEKFLEKKKKVGKWIDEIKSVYDASTNVNNPVDLTGQDGGSKKQLKRRRHSNLIDPVNKIEKKRKIEIKKFWTDIPGKPDKVKCDYCRKSRCIKSRKTIRNHGLTTHADKLGLEFKVIDQTK